MVILHTIKFLGSCTVLERKAIAMWNGIGFDVDLVAV